MFLHCFEESGLNLRRRAVDFVGKDDVREDGSALHHESPGRLVENLRSDDVRGEQVGSELNSVKRSVDRFGECADGECLREAGDALEKYVTTGQKRDQEALDHSVLTNNAFPDFVDDGFRQIGCDVLCHSGKLSGGTRRWGAEALGRGVSTALPRSRAPAPAIVAPHPSSAPATPPA
jgi:hypothetical protein